MRRAAVVLLIAEILFPWVQTQTQSNVAPDENVQMDFEMKSNSEEVFYSKDGTKQYVFVNSPNTYNASREICTNIYTAKLAVARTEDDAIFLAEALSETNLLFDAALWLGGFRFNDTWYWQMDEPEKETIGEAAQEPIDDQVLKLFIRVKGETNRSCLVIERKEHDIPALTQLDCLVRRAFICERSAGQYETGTSHDGWMSVAGRLFKVFVDRVTWDEAEIKCMQYDYNARLAFVKDFTTAFVLGTQLVSGRPSMENAWIGARWSPSNLSYVFEHEGLALANMTDPESRFPPWRNSSWQKPLGCVLLDGHIASPGLISPRFVEVQCHRRRSFICSKTEVPEDQPFKDYPYPSHDYRVYFTKLSWYEARKTCKSTEGGSLASFAVEVDEAVLVTLARRHTVEIMNMWVGGYFNQTAQKWFFDEPRGEVTNTEHFLGNISFYESIEKFNTCLNLETYSSSNISWVLYGTVCNYPQNFICMYPPGTFNKNPQTTSTTTTTTTTTTTSKP